MSSLPVNLYLGFSKARNFGDWWLYEVIRDELTPLRLVPIQRALRPRLRQQVYRLGAHPRVPRARRVVVGGGTLLLPGAPDILNGTRLGARKYSIGSGAKSTEELELFHRPDPAWRERVLEDFAAFDQLTVRGPRTQDTLGQLGISSTVVGDPFLGLYSDDACAVPEDRGTVLLNIADLDVSQSHHWQPPGGDLDDFYADLIDGLRARNLSVHPYYVAPEDKSISERIAARFQLGTPSSAMDPTAMDALFSSASGNIALRLHAGIYGFVRRFPTSMLAYQDKHLDFLDSVGVEGVPRLSELGPEPLSQVLDMWSHFEGPAWENVRGRIEALNRSRTDLYTEIRRSDS